MTAKTEPAPIGPIGFALYISNADPTGAKGNYISATLNRTWFRTLDDAKAAAQTKVGKTKLKWSEWDDCDCRYENTNTLDEMRGIGFTIYNEPEEGWPEKDWEGQEYSQAGMPNVIDCKGRHEMAYVGTEGTIRKIIQGDCLEILQRYVGDSTVNLIVTSPPYGNQRKSSYGGIEPAKYVSWFLRRAEEFKRVLKADGSFVLNISPHTEKNGEEAAYVTELIMALREPEWGGWFHIDTYAWVKPNACPGNATRRLRNAWEPCFHFALRPNPAFYPDQVRKPAKSSTKKRAIALSRKECERRDSEIQSGLAVNAAKAAVPRKYSATGSGVNFRNTPKSVCDANGLVLPDNIINAAPEVRNLHKLYGNPNTPKGMASAPFPELLPAYFIELMTKEGGVVLDPFSGSGSTVRVAQLLGRGYIAIEQQAANIELTAKRLQDSGIPGWLKNRTEIASDIRISHQRRQP